MSGSELFLAALFPPCPILQSVDQVTVLLCVCVLFIHPSYATHNTLLKLPNRHIHARPTQLKPSLQSAVRANMLQHYREMVVIVSQEPVELKCRNTRL